MNKKKKFGIIVIVLSGIAAMMAMIMTVIRFCYGPITSYTVYTITLFGLKRLFVINQWWDVLVVPLMLLLILLLYFLIERLEKLKKSYLVWTVFVASIYAGSLMGALSLCIISRSLLGMLFGGLASALICGLTIWIDVTIIGLLVSVLIVIFIEEFKVFQKTLQWVYVYKIKKWLRTKKWLHRRPKKVKTMSIRKKLAILRTVFDCSVVLTTIGLIIINHYHLLSNYTVIWFKQIELFTVNCWLDILFIPLLLCFTLFLAALTDFSAGKKNLYLFGPILLGSLFGLFMMVGMIIFERPFVGGLSVLIHGLSFWLGFTIGGFVISAVAILFNVFIVRPIRRVFLFIKCRNCYIDDQKRNKDN